MLMRIVTLLSNDPSISEPVNNLSDHDPKNQLRRDPHEVTQLTSTPTALPTVEVSQPISIPLPTPHIYPINILF